MILCVLCFQRQSILTFNKFIYGINTIIKCGNWQPVKLQFGYRSWTGSEIKWFLCNIIQRSDKKIISFLVQFKNVRLTEILQAVRCNILWSYQCHISIYQTFLDEKNAYFWGVCARPRYLFSTFLIAKMQIYNQHVYLFIYLFRERQSEYIFIWHCYDG